jgi:hypothetical protein
VAPHVVLQRQTVIAAELVLSRSARFEFKHQPLERRHRDLQPSLEHLLSGGTKLTWGHANKLGKPVLHVYDNGKEQIFNSDLLRLEVQALTDFLCANKIDILNVADPSGISNETSLRSTAAVRGLRWTYTYRFKVSATRHC